MKTSRILPATFSGIAALGFACALSIAPQGASAQEATHDFGRTFASIARPTKTARCPTGYIANGSSQICESYSAILPKAQPKSGACPAGTVEEFGAYCTATTNDMSERMAGLIARHYFQDLNSNYQNSLGAANSVTMEIPPVMAAYMRQRAAAGLSSSLLSDGSPMPARLPTALPIQCAGTFSQGIDAALRCNDAVGIARGQQAQAGAPVTTQEQITGIGAAQTGAAAAQPAAPAAAPAANPKDALKQGLKGLLAK
jgi:hypothetical protein